MLVLSRKKNERIILGDGVEIVIVDIRGDKVRLGFDADKGIPIHRKEVWEAIQNGQRDTGREGSGKADEDDSGA